MAVGATQEQLASLEMMLETQLHHYYPGQLLNPTSTTSQNHSTTTGLLPRNILTGKIKLLSNHFLLMTNFPNCWLVCLLSDHSIFLLPIPNCCPQIKTSPKNRLSWCFQRGEQPPLSISLSLFSGA